MKNNLEVRDRAKECGVKHWQIAVALGISEQTLMRWLRVPLSPEKENAILEAIQSISKEGNTSA